MTLLGKGTGPVQHTLYIILKVRFLWILSIFELNCFFLKFTDGFLKILRGLGCCLPMEPWTCVFVSGFYEFYRDLIIFSLSGTCFSEFYRFNLIGRWIWVFAIFFCPEPIGSWSRVLLLHFRPRIPLNFSSSDLLLHCGLWIQVLSWTFLIWFSSWLPFISTWSDILLWMCYCRLLVYPPFTEHHGKH